MSLVNSNEADGKFVKKKVTVGTIEADEQNILVNCEIEATILGENGKIVRIEKKPAVKKIKVKTLNEHSNIRTLAEDIVKKCKLIHPRNLEHIVQLLYLMQKKKFEEDYSIEGDRDSKILKKQREEMEQREGEKIQQEAAMANIDDLDTYMDLLYENEIEKKVKGTMMLMHLSRNVDNLESMIGNGPLLSSLARVLTEDGKKSMELCINILYIFYSFSHFSQFHHIITSSPIHIGDNAMKTIEIEMKRHEVRLEDIKKKHSSLKGLDKNGEEYKKIKEELASIDKKFKMLTRKQNQLLYVCIHILLNLAEDVTIECKMKKRKIVTILVKILERDSTDLLILAVTFLKKLSIFRENKNEMAEAHIVEKLTRFIPCENQVLLNVSIRLLLNLSFDSALRLEMVQQNLIPKLVPLMRHQAHVQAVLKLLYHLSMDDGCKSLFTYTEAVPTILELIVTCPDILVSRELAALAVNLTTNVRNGEMMCENGGLKRLIERVLTAGDSLLAKVVRNISQHDLPRNRELFRRYIGDFVSLAVQTENPDLLVELFGILSTVSSSEDQHQNSQPQQQQPLNYSRIIEQHDLLNFLYRQLVPGYAEDDIVLETVIFIGAITSDAKCSAMVARSPIVKALLDLVIEKQEDDEMILQIMYTIYKFILQEETRILLLSQTQIVPYLMDLLQDTNEEIRKMADQTLDVIMDTDESWAVRIRKRKFEIHNAQWLDAIEDEELYEAEKMQNGEFAGADEGWADKSPNYSSGSPLSSGVAAGFYAQQQD